MPSRRLLVLFTACGVLGVLLAAVFPEAVVPVIVGFVSVAAVLARALRAAEDRERLAEVRRLEASLERRIGELAGERRRMERLLERLPLGVLLFIPSGLAYANPAARAMFPGAAEHGRSPLRVLMHSALAQAVAEARESGRTVHLEVQRDDRWLAARAVVTAKGEVALVVTDQTEARRLEATRRDFVVNASHELKTPAASMQALADSLELALTRDPERARGMAERLRLEATRLGQLVRELLDLARLEEQSTETRARIDLAAIVREEAARVEADARDRELTVTVDVPGELGLVAVDEDVRLIVANLLENALRYNRPGGRVHVRARRQGDELVLEVADTGIGLADADRARVFERFYRVDRARSRAQGGTGLGLALVRHAAQRHGGDVSVDSVLGEGSTFRVTLPVVAEAGPS